MTGPSGVDPVRGTSTVPGAAGGASIAPATGAEDHRSLGEIVGVPVTGQEVFAIEPATWRSALLQLCMTGSGTLRRMPAEGDVRRRLLSSACPLASPSARSIVAAVIASSPPHTFGVS